MIEQDQRKNEVRRLLLPQLKDYWFRIEVRITAYNQVLAKLNLSPEIKDGIDNPVKYADEYACQ